MKKYGALLEILRFYKKHIKFYMLFVFILLLKAIISFFSAMLIAQIIANIMDSKFADASKLAFINLLILIIYHILSYVNTYFYKNLENKVRYDLQQTVIQSALNIKMSYYDTFSSGTIVTRLTSDIDKISETFKSLTEKIVNIIRRIAYLFYIFVLNYYIGLYVIGSVIIVSLIYTIRIHYLSKLKPIVKSKREVVNSKIIETIRAIKDIKTLNCDNNILDLIGESQNDYIKADNHEYYIGNGLCKFTDLVISFFDYLFIIISIFLIKNYGLTITVFYTCYLYKEHTFSLANEIGNSRYKIAECEVCAKRLISLIHPDIENIDSYGEESLYEYEGDITFENVCFSYSKSNNILSNLSFNIKPKETIAIVGESGSGKSTIINLIGHLYYKNAGKILFGNVEIDQLSKDFIRDNITIVNQFPYLFNLSIRDNFKVINDKISDEEIWNLCDKVMLKDYILHLPNGLDSIIGEGGCQLSGGQRQRLAIARALARNTKVMIFDEATSSLDNNSQKEVMEVIKKLANKITIIIIAHRLTTITYADSIILMKSGKLIDIDKHENLIKKNSYYKSLYLKSIGE